MELLSGRRKYWFKRTDMYYYLFLFLMISAKAIGLDSGDKTYYVLAICAFTFWIMRFLKIRWTTHSLVYSGILISITLLSTFMKGSLGLLLSVMALVALKDLDREIIMGLVLKVWSFFMIAMIILVNLGIVVDKISVQTNKTWHGMGYSHGNLFHASFSIIIIMYLYRRKEKVTFVETLLSLGVNYLVYQYSASKSGMIIGVSAALLFYIYKFIRGREKLNKIAMVALCFGMIMIVVLSFVLPRAYNWNWAGNELPSVLNRMLTGRIQHAKTSMMSDPLTLFGNGEGLSAFVDNAYVFLLMGYGIVPTVMVGILYIIALISMIKRGDCYGVIIIFLFVLYGSVEQFFVNAFMNYSILFVGNEIMNIVIKQ